MSSEIKVDTISENTSANGVVIDSVTLKDGAVTATAASTITTADTSTNLTLKSTDASASAAPRMIFERDSASPADSDQLGLTMYFADNDAGESTNFFEIKALAVDVSDGTEDGQLRFSGMNGGSSVEYMRFDPGSAGTIFNDGSADIDFRVEGQNDTHLIFVDAGNDRVQFNRSTADESGATICSSSDEDTHATGTFDNTNSSFDVNSQHNLGVVTHTTANEARMFRVVSGNGSSTSFSDNEFIVRNDGTTLQDGSASTSGADYAEFFEWKDGNSSDEDRVGFSVILDGDQIVKATDSDDASKIIGVVSGNPTILGDAAPLRWKQKYLRDDFNRHLQEEYTVTEWKEVDENGKKVKNHSYHTDRIPSDVTAPSDATVKTTYGDGTKMTRRKSNPDYDSSKEYIPREKRKEWETIGLMGKLRILKGQPTGTNWIKMRDISTTVEEWLVK